VTTTSEPAAASRQPRLRRGGRRVAAGAGWSAVLIATALLGCAGHPVGDRELAWRWIETDLPEVFEISAHQVRTEAFQLTFPAGGPLPDGWSSKRLAPAGSVFTVEGPASLEASKIREIIVQVEHSGSGQVGVQLQWAPPDEGFSQQRTIRLSRKLPWKLSTSEFRFSVVNHPGWRGPISKLGVLVESAGGTSVQGVAGYSASIDPAALSGDLARPWKIDVGGEIRNGWVSVPGFAHRSRCRVPPEGGTLRVSFGHLERSQAPLHYRITVNDRGRPRQVFSSTLSPDDLPMAAWQPAEVDLARWAGREVELSLEASADLTAGELLGLPVWANPEIVVRATREPPVSVVLISIDTLRADRMSLYGHDRPTTPNIADWAARRGTVFTNAVVQASWTLPSHTSMLSGVSAFRHGVNYNNAAPGSLKLLSEYLREAGYATLAVTGGAWVHPQYHLGQGFDRFWYWSGIDPATGAPMDGASNELDVVLREAVARLREYAHEPFFLFLHTYDIHYREAPRQPYFSQFSQLDPTANVRWRAVPPAVENGYKRDKLRVLRTADGDLPLPPSLAGLPADIYDSRIAYLDSRLPALFGELDALGLTDRTLVIFTSDHGELLGEHGLYAHVCLYDENLLVPLIIAEPGGVRTQPVIETQVRSIDIVPTVLEHLGIAPDPTVEGESLVDLMRRGADGRSRPAWSYAASSNYGMSLRLDSGAKLILNNTAWAPVAGDTEFYRLDVDPGELANIPGASEIPAMRRQLAEQYLGTVPSVRIELSNPGGRDFELTLANVINQINLKAVDLDCDCVRWQTSRQVAAVVPAGQRYTLVLEHAQTAKRPLQITAGGGAAAGSPRQAVVDLRGDLQQRLTLEWTGAGWLRSEDGTDDRLPRVSLSWAGTSHLEQRGETAVGNELKERLRALGYIE
jgi:arylsulfatase A-like enzyme